MTDPMTDPMTKLEAARQLVAIALASHEFPARTVAALRACCIDSLMGTLKHPWLFWDRATATLHEITAWEVIIDILHRGFPLSAKSLPPPSALIDYDRLQYSVPQLPVAVVEALQLVIGIPLHIDGVQIYKDQQHAIVFELKTAANGETAELLVRFESLSLIAGLFTERVEIPEIPQIQYLIQEIQRSGNISSFVINQIIKSLQASASAVRRAAFYIDAKTNCIHVVNNLPEADAQPAANQPAIMRQRTHWLFNLSATEQVKEIYECAALYCLNTLVDTDHLCRCDGCTRIYFRGATHDHFCNPHRPGRFIPYNDWHEHGADAVFYEAQLRAMCAHEPQQHTRLFWCKDDINIGLESQTATVDYEENRYELTFTFTPQTVDPVMGPVLSNYCGTASVMSIVKCSPSEK